MENLFSSCTLVFATRHVFHTFLHVWISWCILLLYWFGFYVSVRKEGSCSMGPSQCRVSLLSADIWSFVPCCCFLSNSDQSRFLRNALPYMLLLHASSSSSEFLVHQSQNWKFSLLVSYLVTRSHWPITSEQGGEVCKMGESWRRDMYVYEWV